jgi:tRNA threonylcarbamoyladenosine biosynthesis protein TsaE
VSLERAPASGADLEALGEAWGRLTVHACRLALIGPLGSGKTTFMRGFARGLGVTEGVTSPTFVIEKRYDGRLLLRHLDLYRVDDAPAVLADVLDDVADTPDLATIVAVEWADRAGDGWADVTVRFTTEPRTVSATAASRAGRAVLDGWR